MRIVRWALAFAIVACDRRAPPAGQILLYVDTDAPIAPTGGPIPLFDRIRVDVLPAGSDVPCTSCSNTIAVDGGMFRDRKVSFGIVPRPDTGGSRVRIRLFRVDFVDTVSGEPDPFVTVDVIATLPAIGREGVREVTLDLDTDGVGQTITKDLRPGKPETSRVSTWGPAQRTGCEGSHDGELCVPGGAFWLGASPDQIVDGAPPSWHRLATISPFFLGAKEVTVRDARMHGLPAKPWSTSESGLSFDDWCTFTPTSVPRGNGMSDDLPVSCVAWSDARNYCRAIGADLPTEAQFEFVLGGTRGDRWVWGNDATPDSACEIDGVWKAIWGRGGTGLLYGAYDACRKDDFLAIGGPEPAGPRLLDTLDLEDGSIVDLAGNLMEWAIDSKQDRTDSCWVKGGIYADPKCTESAIQKVIKGGSYNDYLSGLRASRRTFRDLLTYPSDVGFRCARPGQP